MTVKRFYTLFCILLIQVLCVYGQTMHSDVYEFSIKPETEEWWQFETIGKRIVALQMPDEVLLSISTEGLLETCLNFPYLLDILFANNYQQGFESLVNKFNGFGELLRRSDLADVALEKYSRFSTDVLNIHSKSNIERGMLSFRRFVLEFILVQDVVLQNLTEEQEKQLFLLSFEHKQIKQNFLDIFGNLHDVPANLLYAKKVMNDSEFKFESDELKQSLTCFIQAPVTINQKRMKYIEDYIIAKYK